MRVMPESGFACALRPRPIPRDPAPGYDRQSAGEFVPNFARPPEMRRMIVAPKGNDRRRESVPPGPWPIDRPEAKAARIFLDRLGEAYPLNLPTNSRTRASQGRSPPHSDRLSRETREAARQAGSWTARYGPLGGPSL